MRGSPHWGLGGTWAGLWGGLKEWSGWGLCGDRVGDRLEECGDWALCGDRLGTGYVEGVTLQTEDENGGGWNRRYRRQMGERIGHPGDHTGRAKQQQQQQRVQPAQASETPELQNQ